MPKNTVKNVCQHSAENRIHSFEILMKIPRYAAGLLIASALEFEAVISIINHSLPGECMDAVAMERRDLKERFVMSSGPNTSRTDQLAELRSDVRHLQGHVIEVKSELRAVNQRTDSLRDKFDSLRDMIDSLRDKIKGVQDSLIARMDAMNTRLRTDLTGKIEAVEAKLTHRIDKLELKVDDLGKSLSSAKVWALTLYFGLAGGLLFVLAKGFRWI